MHFDVDESEGNRSELLLGGEYDPADARRNKKRFREDITYVAAAYEGRKKKKIGGKNGFDLASSYDRCRAINLKNTTPFLPYTESPAINSRFDAPPAERKRRKMANRFYGRPPQPLP